MNYFEEINKIKENIDNSDIVSFDIFDTLLLRNVAEPSDIFKIVELKYYNKFNEKIQFYHKRIKAEQEARKKSKFEDIELDEIYNILKSDFGEKNTIELKKLEVESEEEFLVANKYMKLVYDYALKKHKRIIIISDMYLPKIILKRFLEINKIIEYDELYVSSETKKTKATGTIYSYIRKKLSLNKFEKWTHIGDNYISDYKNAKYNGINAIYFKRLINRETNIKLRNLSDSIIYAIQINNKYTFNENQYWEKFGAMIVAPIYIGLMFNMIKWLNGKDNIYFLSRDGYVPYRLYIKLRDTVNNLPEGKYIYASRRAYIYPTLINDKIKAIDLLTIYNSSFNQKLTIKQIFKNLDMDINNYSNILEKYNFNDINEIISDKNIEKVKNILFDLWDDIKIILSNEKKILEEYFHQVGMFNYESINIFDIGWAGSTHKAMIDILNKDIYGYYFGTTEFLCNDIRTKSYGYAFNKGRPCKLGDFIIDNVMMYELMFTAPEGSVKNFRYEKGKIIPVLKDTQDNYGYDVIHCFQEAAINIFDKVLEYREYIDEPSKEFSLQFIERFIEKKKSIDLIEFSKIDNVVAIGESEDYQKYVLNLDYNEYIDNRNYYKTEAKKNLWRGAIAIRDDCGRIFNDREFDKLKGIKNDYFIFNCNDKITLIKKAIRDPKKALKKIICILKKYLFTGIFIDS